MRGGHNGAGVFVRGGHNGAGVLVRGGHNILDRVASQQRRGHYILVRARADVRTCGRADVRACAARRGYV
ncbi:hypothetical protein GCM10027614_16630 [Micromonospora vulcania]